MIQFEDGKAFGQAWPLYRLNIWTLKNEKGPEKFESEKKICEELYIRK